MGKVYGDVSLSYILVFDKLSELKEAASSLEECSMVTSKDVDYLQRLVDTLKKLVDFEERASSELAEESEES